MPVMIRELLGGHGHLCVICGSPATHLHDGVLRCSDPNCYEAIKKRHSEARKKQ